MIQVNALIPALVAGNSVLLKPSPQTPLVAERIQESFEAAGIPRGLIQVRDAFFFLYRVTSGGRKRKGGCLPLLLLLLLLDAFYVSISLFKR